MIYLHKDDLVIRNMIETDPQIICDEEIAQGWHVTTEKYEMRLKDQASGKSVAFVAEYQGNIAGYINVYWNPNAGAYANMGIPEIVDFGVFEKYQRCGIGSALMDVAEQLAATNGNKVCLGVGLHNGYGSAQRMYVKRGYIPDGTGAWYQDKICDQYASCCNDDDLILYLSKEL
ncbi:MAG: N-acetyltransferase [Herbinix sp.]|jgi:GNAT superfamily N-acetyltransferase|nr:N-acetyltransferase [Herbinix sp.]